METGEQAREEGEPADIGTAMGEFHAAVLRHFIVLRLADQFEII